MNSLPNANTLLIVHKQMFLSLQIVTVHSFSEQDTHFLIDMFIILGSITAIMKCL